MTRQAEAREIDCGSLVMKKRGFTLIELLVVISIIAVLISILLPALSAAKETAAIALCQANLRELTKVANMYMDDEGKPTQPWWLDIQGLNYGFISEWVYGGFQHTRQNLQYPTLDTYLIPTNLRPYNKYIAPGITTKTVIKSYIDPSDKSDNSPAVGSFIPTVEEGAEIYPSWTVYGNSYAMNWNWMESPPWFGDGYSPIETMSQHGTDMLRLKVGGEAGKFVLFMENNMDVYMYDARPAGGDYGTSELQELGVGWHRKFSTYAMGFIDGHAEYRFVDTRYSGDAGYETWPSKQTQEQTPP